MHPALLPTAKVNRRTPMEQIEEAIGQCVNVLMKEYDTSGKISNLKTQPEDWWDARNKAREFCYADARRHAGNKVPELKPAEMPKRG